MNIVIPEPCHENWDAMKPEGVGRHCAACSKVVADFSGMSKEEILDFIRKKGKEQVCGRFRADQVHQPVPVKKYRLRNLRFAAAALMVFGTFLFQSCSNPGAVAINGKVKKEQKEIVAAKDSGFLVKDSVRTGARIIPLITVVEPSPDPPHVIMGIVALPENYQPEIPDENK